MQHCLIKHFHVQSKSSWMCAYLIVLMLLQIKAKMSADGSTRPGDRYVRWGIILPIAL